MGRKKTKRASRSVPVFIEAYEAANVLRGLTKEDLQEVVSRLVLEGCNRETPIKMREWLDKHGALPPEPPADQATDP